MIKEFIVGAIKLFMMFSVQVQAPELDFAKHTYQLSLDKRVVCQLPIVDTKEGGFTAAHCIKDLKAKGITEFYGINEQGDVKKFKLKKYQYVDRGLDYALLEDLTSGNSDGVEIAKRSDVKQGDTVIIVSPKKGVEYRTVRVIPDPKYDSLKCYVKGEFSDCGISGSGVYTMKGKLWGIYVAMTGNPQSPDGVVLPMENILKDVRT